MRSRSFFDREHATQYLTGSIIRYDGKPVAVYGIEKLAGAKGLSLSVYPTDNKRASTISTVPIDDPKIDMTPLPLGFVNIKSDDEDGNIVVRVQRYPARRWKVGSYEGNTMVRSLYKDTPAPLPFNYVVSNSQFKHTITGNMPKFEEVKAKMKPRSAWAFDRNFAMDSDLRVFHIHIMDPIGKVEDGKIELDGKYKFLAEQLEEAVGL